MRIATLVAIAMAASITAHAAPSRKLPEAPTILDRYVQVTGGRELYRKFGQVNVYSSVIENGKTTYVTVFHARNGSAQTEIDDGTETSTSGVDDGVVWEYSKAKGAHVLSGKAADREVARWRGLGDDDWRNRYTSAKTMGEQKIGTTTCYHLELTLADGSKIERFYDEQRGLLVRETSTQFNEAGVEEPIETDVREYDSSLGILYPSLMEVRSGAQRLTIRVNSLTYFQANGGFEIPREVVRAVAAARSPQGLPNPVDILDKFIEATGGKSAYQGVKTRTIRGEVFLKEQNLTFPVAVYAAENKSYGFFEVPTMGKFEFGDDGKVSWERSVVLGPRLTPRSPLGGLLGPQTGEILNWTDESLGMQTIAKIELNGRPCYQVKTTTGPDVAGSSTAYFDVDTGYLVKLVLPLGSDQTEKGGETVFSDYRRDGALTSAHHIEINIGGRALSINLKEMSVNSPVPESIFDLPDDVKALTARRGQQTNNDPSQAVDRPTLTRKPQH